MPLAGEKKEELINALKISSPELRHLVSKRVKLRHVPKLFFALDDSYDEAERINNLLKKPDVARDIDKANIDKI